jgi:hypothetical protein
MPTDAFDMAIGHRVFRNELRAAPQLVREMRLLANVPLPKRVLVQLLGPRAVGAYRKKLYASPR